MSDATHINPQYFFYPIGNTPAVNVLHDRFRPALDGKDRERVKAMFLACGDPRNLLFTLYSESGYGEKLKWDFTCCDLEPAILARNVFLFTLIIDKEPIAASWNIFYHLNVRECDVELIRSHTERLLCMSETRETWSSSKYGKIINLMSEDTRVQLRHFWSRYLEVCELKDKPLKSFEKQSRDAITARLEDLGEGPFAYWKTGVVAGNPHDVNDLGLGGHGRINPLLAISSSPDGTFAIHRDTDPLLGFHLAGCFDETSGSQQQFAEKLAKRAQGQFKEWCQTFWKHLRAKTVHINVFCGDALRFCHELQAIYDPELRRTKLARTYAAQWRPTELVLQGLDRPQDRKLFCAIDTSNLMDHVGLLNVLTAISPLLSRRVTSIMFTDTLLKLSEDHMITLSDLLSSDVTTMSLIFGIAPVTHLVGFTPDATSAEAARVLTTPNGDPDNALCWTRIAWKIADFGEYFEASTTEPSPLLVEFQENQLAKFCQKLYLRMFGSETTSASEPDIYTRLSFVSFLEIIKRRIQVRWKPFIKLLIDEINSNLDQELQVTLYLSGLVTDLPVALPPRQLPLTPYGQVRPQSSDNGLLGRKNPPSVVFATLIVPRARLRPFTNQASETAGTPKIQMIIQNESIKMADNYFSIQCFFGKLLPHPDDETRCNAVSDVKGWKGKDDLVVTVAIPTWNLLVGPREGVRVKLTVTPSATAAHYAFRLGPEMEIFGYGLDDQRLQILSHPPGVTFRVQDPPVVASAESNSLEKVCLATLNEKSEAETLRMYTPRVSKTAKRITITQPSPCVLNLEVKHSEDSEDSDAIPMRYPYPIDGSRHKVDFLPHGGIELLIPISPALVTGGYNRNPFPVCMQDSRTITPTIPHVKLDKLPIIDVSAILECKEEMMDWIFSINEQRQLGDKLTPDKTTALLEVKKSIFVLYEVFLESRGKFRIFDLSQRPGICTLLFISALRHTGYQGSVALEAFVVSLTGERLSAIQPFITELANLKEIMNTYHGVKEQGYWKILLPTLIESVRTTWSHGEKCEYREKNNIPLSTEPGEIAICSCGEGVDVNNFPRCANWEQFAKYAHRMAIPPISPVPFIETIAEEGTLQYGGILEHLPPIAPAASSAPVKRDKCDQCGKKSQTKLRRCQRCEKTKYCNHACQKAAWKEHKKQCKKG